MRALLTCVCLLSFLASAANAQTGWVEGRVTDGEKPMAYANMLLGGTQVGAATDDGDFRFRAPCGRFTLRVVRVPIRPIGMPIDLTCPH